jgi:hypothetical protein
VVVVVYPSFFFDAFKDDKWNALLLMQKLIEVKPEILSFVSSPSYTSLTLFAP